MKLTRIVYEPKAELEFTRADIRVLMKASKHHYDGVCQSLSRPGRGAVIWRIKNGHTGPFRFRDIDLLAKCCEMTCHFAGDRPVDKQMREVGSSLHFRLMGVLKQLNDAYEKSKSI